jgi:hypothetical protein
MKALPMLDHVMLRVARLFAGIFLLLWLFLFVLPLLYPPHIREHALVLSALLVLSIFWNLSLWNLNKGLSRLVLGLSALSWLIFLFWNISQDAAPDFGDMVFILFNFAGIASMFWVAIWPPDSFHSVNSV